MATFRARLRGRNEVPPVLTNARGSATFREIFGRTGNDNGNDNGNGDNNRRRVRALRFVLVLRNIRRVTDAHIHLGRPGQNGPVVATLFGPSRQGVSFRRGVIRGTLRSSDLVGPLRGRSIRALVREIERGNAYVNVHTIRFPNGEIRGQIREVFIPL
ncbi:CHRD domain-containing protein [Paenibacillus sp. LHD-117]|uniref:CHRD domain-containing protein n=1 Tax=Paenibacillus sp. LHD-117 TaxID=3071412 RepID=UPI0027E17A4B|nr:CHRD domain-containing protein [Paenibacillus sp. LHD-117]MDQ6422940.1 CHRD domain-containing protein [Paenibacillus sp. LHD-117]